MNLSKNSDLNTIADELNYEIKNVNNIQILDNDFPGLKNQRRVVQWLFSEETSISDFKRFDVANGGYLIAQVIGITEKGLSSVENSSFKILPEVIKSKKADFIISQNDNSLSISEIAVKSATLRSFFIFLLIPASSAAEDMISSIKSKLG